MENIYIWFKREPAGCAVGETEEEARGRLATQGMMIDRPAEDIIEEANFGTNGKLVQVLFAGDSVHIHGKRIGTCNYKVPEPDPVLPRTGRKIQL